MTRADWLAATPKCPRDGEPMVWVDRTLSWRCPHHAVAVKGLEVARAAGYAGVWFEDAA